MTGATHRLASFASSLSYSALDAEVVRATTHALVDTLGCMFAGIDAPAGPPMLAYLDTLAAGGPSTVIGSPTKHLGQHAALANGTFGHALDADDGHRGASAHPGVTVIPAALAAAEKQEATGEELIAAIVAGYEAICTTAEAVQPSHRERGFHGTATCGCFGAAAAVASLLDLDAEATTHALGLAGTQAGGLFEFLADGSEAKRFHAGRAAMAGVLAGDLAAQGLDGPTAIIEGTDGFARAFADESDLGVFESLGDPFEITRIYRKPYPCCRHIHGPIDASLTLRDGVDPHEINRIRVETYRSAAHHDKTEVATLLDAQMSIPYGVALAFLTGSASLDGFLPPRTDGPVAEFASRVEVRRTDEMDEKYPNPRAARVVVETETGAVEETVDYALGEPENPMSETQLKTKFDDMTGGRLDPGDRDALFEAILSVDQFDDVSDLTARL